MKIEIIDRINECPKCNQLMERRKHKVIGEKQLTKTYYFSEWDFCKSCNHVQHYEEYKVLPSEIVEQNNLFNNI